MHTNVETIVRNFYQPLCPRVRDTQCIVQQNQFKTLNLADATTETWIITGQAEGV